MCIRGDIMKVIYRIVIALAVLATAILAILSLHVHMQPDFIDFPEALTAVSSNPFIMLLGAAAFIAINLAIINIAFLYTLSPKRRMTIFFLVCLCAEIAAGAVWLQNYAIRPVSDQANVWNMAGLFDAHMGQKGDMVYFKAYSQQKAIVILMSVFIRIFGSDGLFAYRCFCLFCAASCVLLGGMLAYRISGREKAGCMASLLLTEFVPLILYSAYVYGTIPSICLMLIAFYSVIRLFQTGRTVYLIPEVISCGCMYAFYTGTLIAIIAIIFTSIYFVISSGRKMNGKMSVMIIIGTVLSLLLTFTINKGAGYYFEVKSGLSADEDHLPAAAWILMGMESNPVIGPGGYDGSNLDLFYKNNQNTKLTNAAAKKEIFQLFNEYRSGKRDGSFFIGKTITQWTDPWYGGLTMTIYNKVDSDDLGNLTPLFVPDTLERIQAFLSMLMISTYLVVLFYLIKLIFGKNISQSSLLLPVYIVGGFVFQLFWETKSRYCLPYYICMLILAGIGMICFMEWLNKDMLHKTRR